VKITDNRRGLLRGDRTHVAKLFASIQPGEHWRAGSYLHFQSGGAWEARGLPDANVSSSSFVRYLEPAGSRRMPSWFDLDLLAAYDFPLSVVGCPIEARGLERPQSPGAGAGGRPPESSIAARCPITPTSARGRCSRRRGRWC